MREELVDEIEEFVRRGKLWNAADLNALIGRLESEADATNDPIPRQLSAPLRALLVRMRIGEVPNRLASDVEGIVDSSHTGLVAHAIAGNSAAFARLVEPYLPSALSSARLILGGSGDAADAVQDALISAWREKASQSNGMTRLSKPPHE